MMDFVDIDKQTIKDCMNRNIRNPDKNNSIVDNLENQKKKFIEEEIMIWPSLFINSLSYRVALLLEFY